MDVRSYFPLKNTVVDNAIPDVSISEDYANQVYAFYRSGILTGGDGNYFYPQTTIQRCEVAAILNRMLNPDQRKSVTLMNAVTFPVTPEAPAKPEFVLPAGVPAYDAPVTLENVLALLDHYDPDGAFGLLSEFNAYCWEMNTAVQLFDYLAANESNQIFANHFTAYAEFRYWILHYMLYAKEHHPDMYQGLLAHDAFRQAFTTTDQLFAGFVQAYFDKMEAWGKEVYQPFQNEYDILMTEMQKPEYVQMAALLQP